MRVFWIALRIINEIVRDRRTVAFLLLVPIVVMTLIYFAVVEDESVDVGVVTRGAARLFDGDLVRAIESEDNVEVVSLNIPDDETDKEILIQSINESLATKEADAVLYLDESLLIDRFDDKEGTLHIYLEGTHPTVTATSLSAIASAMDDLAASLPTVIDASCSALCAESVNSKPMELEEHYLHGSDDYRMIDFFLPVFPPFFVFFFTFILATVVFQRERVNGTLERLMIMPMGFGKIIFGYVLGFLLFGTLQASIVLAYVLVLISFPITLLQILDIALITFLMMLIALLLGLLASFAAKNEFQAVQFIPLVILPQIFLSDMIWDINSFPLFFKLLSYPLPLTHANSIMRDVLLKDMSLWQSWPQLVILISFIVVITMALIALGKRNNHGLA
ncbi:MAG: ABC transporter permease [Gammaproteobacteria bacterium]|nr:ABC transporter permease [Gammaproteobacteria bacterium]